MSSQDAAVSSCCYLSLELRIPFSLQDQAARYGPQHSTADLLNPIEILYWDIEKKTDLNKIIACHLSFDSM